MSQLKPVRGYGTAFGDPRPMNQTVYINEDRCPRCRSKLMLKRNRTDRTRFFGCSAWPNCGYTRSI
jgi:hypothetical protein